MNIASKQVFPLKWWAAPFLTAMIIAGGCDYLPDSVKDWQKKQVQKRYGSAFEKDPEKIPQWQEDLKPYEEIIDSKVKAGEQAARLHRKIGESYGESQMYQLCIDHLKKAIELGYHDPDVYYSLGLCEGALARNHNWNYTMTKTAEETFLKVLQLNQQYEFAKLQLGIIYFFGFGNVLQYRVRSEVINVTRQEFRKKAITLVKEYRFQVPNDTNACFALAQMYVITKQPNLAIEEYRQAAEIITRENPDTYQNHPAYIKAMDNLKALMIKN